MKRGQGQYSDVKTPSAHHGLSRKPILALTLLGLLGCAGSGRAPTPIPTHGRASHTDSQACERALTLYAQGKLDEALTRLRSCSELPVARALVAVSTTNRPRSVLDARDIDDQGYLRYRAIAAWRDGDGAAVEQIVRRLSERQTAEVAELEALAALGRAASRGRLGRVVQDEPVPAGFDPRLRVPIIDVEVGGERLHFILDTGAEATLIDARVAERLEVRRPEGARVTVHGNSGEVTTMMGLVDRLEVLGRTFQEVPVVLADLSHLPSQMAVSGILSPQDLFRDGVLRIDHRQGQVSRSAASRPVGAPLLYPYGRAIIAIEGQMQDGPRGLFRLDTGGRRSVLTNEYVDLALASGARWTVHAPESVEVRGVGGTGVVSRQRRVVAASRFCATGFPISLDFADIPVDTTAADSLIAYAGKLGADAFAGRTLELDYAASRIRISGQ